MRPELMHDGESRTFSEAILRHAGKPTGVIDDFKALTATQQEQLIEFLKSL